MTAVPVRDALVGFLFRNSMFMSIPDGRAAADAFLAQYPVIAMAQESVTLLEEIKGRLVTREDMDAVKVHLDLCNPKQPREVTA